jgi:hypothetical protein
MLQRMEMTSWRLTVKLSGRVEASQAHQSVITLIADKAPTHTSFHGPLQRLLEVTLPTSTVPVRPNGRNWRRHSVRVKRAQGPPTKPIRAWRAAPQARLLSNKLEKARAPCSSEAEEAARALCGVDRRRLQTTRSDAVGIPRRQAKAFLALRDAWLP